VLVLGGAATGWALIRSHDQTATQRGGSGGQSSSTTSPPATTSPSATTTTSPTTDAVAAAEAALAACAKEVKAGEAVAARAAVSAAHWTTHTNAQIRFDKHEYTLAQTKAAWAASKATGSQDVSGFRSADKAYAAVDGACAKASGPAAGTDLATRTSQCAARAAALARIERSGAVVNSQWAAHLVMMAHKDHYVTAAYRVKWEGMVRAAQPALSLYRSAAAGLAKAPSCKG
jgi:hypothetical protein